LNAIHLKTIQKIAERLANKYVFGYLDQDDIIQEAVIFGLEAYDRWDGERPLENFISVHISNRLKNFKRDNYFRLGLEQSSPKRQKSNETKRNLMKPAPIHPFSLFTEESIDNQDSIDFLLSKMPPLIKNDFLRMSNGVTVTKGRKQAVIDSVKEILGEDW
jgi:DNA-directed RNA polymerase specialized sigma24 family protein